LVLLIAGLTAVTVRHSRGVEPAQCKPGCASSVANSATWQIVETGNFRILSYGIQKATPQVAQSCERLRGELCRQWLGDRSPAVWSPKCDLVLHPSDQSYLREVGQAGQSTVASSMIGRPGGAITARRIDIRATRADWQTAALPHELTHLVLADRFTTRQLPRWSDEGMAVLADPAAKQERHLRDLEQALATGTSFRVAELLALDRYPAGNRWGTFYGQSASLVRFLVQRGTPATFADFVQLASERGYDAALRDGYHIDGVADLERQWRGALAQAAKLSQR
jgi:hypothetical protein